MTSVSILIVTYNSENEIRGCLNSILHSFNDIQYQIVITDNHSSDKTVEIIGNIDDKNIHLIQNDDNLGFTKAINQCLDKTTLENILILNPDTVIPNDDIKGLIGELSKDKSIGIVAPQLRYPNNSVQKSCRRFPRRRDIIYESFGLSRLFSNMKEFGYWKMVDFDHTQSRFVEQPAGAALLMRKNLIDDIGNFDERFPMFFSDVDYCRRVINSGHKIKFSSDVSITHLGGASIYRNRAKMIISSHISFWKYFVKYKKGLFNQFINIIVGIFLMLIIPVRILFNAIRPSKKIKIDKVF